MHMTITKIYDVQPKDIYF